MLFSADKKKKLREIVKIDKTYTHGQKRDKKENMICVRRT